MGEGLLSGFVKVVRAVPGVGLIERELAGIERIVLREFGRRLESVADDHRLPRGGGSRPRGSSNGSRWSSSDPQSLAEAMEQMLRRSMDQSPSDSRRSLFEHVVRELVPDEARILAALADGSRYPLLDVVAAPRGKAARVVLRNASNVGRAAGVAVPSLVPTYVTHLLALGLVETAPENPKLEDEYQILMTESEVKSAHAEAASAGFRASRIVRGTLRISALGRDFWAAARPDPVED